MSSHSPSSPAARSGRLARSPVVRRDGQWWLVADSGSVLATDPTFTGELDRFAAAMADADRAVADLRSEQGGPPAPRPGRQR
ncbi:hypothetical protein OIC43_03525 [Streptomyces sp. NBC_00825]|uniref:hypothetical protein n=1 Tax=unclassified Streptomyces TaxID=2593676 RepID=UPI002ED3F64E|nr:hypothetical protein OG832_40190 [Streptomyces sp. NBC_00826]WTH88200.1 hypothetical protein OIC43_03525 [Streptomyces sp. NBC_00825]WTH96928.1 hypothetical protein OHA23_03525 [Streptomyces sp. NBC_00822]